MTTSRDLFERATDSTDALQRFVATEVERQYVDFKQHPSTTPRPNERAPDDFIDGLAKEVAGFATSDGGIIVIGVDDDVRKRVLAGDASAENALRPWKGRLTFSQRFFELLPLSVSPPVDGIDVKLVGDESPDGGFVVIHVPSSPAAPHMALRGKANATRRYFRRSGESSEPALSRLREHERVVRDAAHDDGRVRVDDHLAHRVLRP